MAMPRGAKKSCEVPLKFAGAAPKTNSAEGQKVLSPPKAAQFDVKAADGRIGPPPPALR
jgi:hypothetical protein